MKLPNCYDPVVQEERRQRDWDRRIQRFPVCGCCGRVLRGGDVYYVLNYRDQALNVCDSCREDMDENVCCVEEMG
ncbi:MAG: hypothetical protein ACI4PH_09145 [Faecousia sp.]